MKAPNLILDPCDPAGADTVYIVNAETGETVIRCMDRKIRDWIVGQSLDSLMDPTPSMQLWRGACGHHWLHAEGDDCPWCALEKSAKAGSVIDPDSAPVSEEPKT